MICYYNLLLSIADYLIETADFLTKTAGWFYFFSPETVKTISLSGISLSVSASA